MPTTKRRPIRAAGIASVVTLLAISLTTAANAQQVGTRQGFWGSGGLGMGFGAARCNVCSGSREAGLSASLGAGAALNPSLAIGVDGNGWRSQEGGVDLGLGAVTALLLWYPNPHAPWYFSVGSGLLFYRADDDDPDVPAVTARSLGLRAGVGYDFRIADQFSLTPFFNFLGSVGANLAADGESLTGARLTLIQFGAGFTYR
jgi:hypothetical protein